MKIEIILKNQEYCDGCPFLDDGNAQLGYICKHYYTWLNQWISPFKRLKKCIKENGK